MKNILFLTSFLFFSISCSKTDDSFPGEIGVWVLDDITADYESSSFINDLDDYKNLSWLEFLDESSTYEGYKKLKLNSTISFLSQSYNPSGELELKANLVWKRSGEKIYIKDTRLDQSYVLYVVGKNLRIERNSGGIIWYYWLRKR